MEPESFLNMAFLTIVLATGLRMAATVLFAAIGEIFSERSGVLNLGIEGIMEVGAVVGVLGAYYLGGFWSGMVLGMVAGVFFGLLMAYLSVTLGGNQVVNGLLIWIMGTGVASYINRAVTGLTLPKLQILRTTDIPLFSQIPVIGTVVFQQNIFVYLSFLLVIISAVVLFRTTWGLKIIAIGENPKAADTAGIDVFRFRYLCVVIGSALAGIGGAYIPIATTGEYFDGLVYGRGFIAIAFVIFGSWNPYKVFAGCLLFGAVNALQMQLQVAGIGVSYHLLLTLPYIITLATLIVMPRKVSAPRSLGIPYRRGE